MDSAPVSGTGGCRFGSCQGRRSSAVNLCSSMDRVPVYEAGDGSSILSRGTSARVAQRIQRWFPKPESAGSNPAVGTDRHSQRREHGWYVRHAYNVRVAGSIPARRTMFHHCRISSTGKSTCFVTRRRGFESCIRLHAVPHWEGSAAAAKRPRKPCRATTSRRFDSYAFRRCTFRLRSSTERAASFYLARCGFKSRRRLRRGVNNLDFSFGFKTGCCGSLYEPTSVIGGGPDGYCRRWGQYGAS